MRNKDTMRFGNVVWQMGPDDLKLNRSRNLSCTIQRDRNYLFDGGEEAGSIVCSGCFFGEDADERLKELEVLLQKGEILPLSVPGVGVTPAKLKKLEYEGKKGFGKAGYRLEFMDLRGLDVADKASQVSGKTYTALGGESMWDVSLMTDIPLEELIRLNPHIRHISSLEKEAVLWLR